MASDQRVLDRRDRSFLRRRSIGLSLILCFAARAGSADTGLPPDPPAAGRAVRPDARSIRDTRLLAKKQQQVTRLHQMLDSPAPRIRGPRQDAVRSAGRARRCEQMLRLARLELEVAVFQGAAGSGAADFAAPATTCRRLLTEEPTCRLVDRARLLLGRVELRRGRVGQAVDVLDDLERLHPRSPLLCEALLTKGNGYFGAAQRKNAAAVYRRILSRESCAGGIQRQARYKLAWSHLGQKQGKTASRELRRLASRPGISRRIRMRVLGDLALSWSVGRPDPDAASFLLSMAGRKDGLALIVQLGQRLLDERRLPELLALTGGAIARAKSSKGSDLAPVFALRLGGLSRGGNSSSFRRELESIARLRGKDSAASAGLDRVAAEAMLARGHRLHREKNAGARDLYELLARRYPAQPAAHEAMFHLGELLLEAGQRDRAASAFEALVTRASEPLRKRASYRLVYCLERALGGRAADVQAKYRKFSAAARRFVQRYPGAPETASLLLSLASRQLMHGEASAAVRSLDALRASHPGAARKRPAVELSLQALSGAGLPRRAFELARVSVSACKRRCGVLRRFAASSALEVCRAIVARGRWGEAHGWAVRAAASDPGSATSRRALLTAATLAARAGMSEQAAAHYRQLRKEARTPTGRIEAGKATAEYLESSGRLLAAARVYEELIALEGGVDGRLRWMHRAAVARLHGQDRRGLMAAILKIRKELRSDDLAPGLIGKWQLDVGEILRAAGGPAYEHYTRQAHRLWRYNPEAAATCLIRAAALTRSSKKALRFFRQALPLAGPLSRGRKVSAAAIQARLGIARTVRTRRASAAGSPRQELVALQDLIPQLMDVLKLGDRGGAIHHAAAGRELVKIYRRIAILLERAPAPADLSQEDRGEYRKAVRERVAQIVRIRVQLERRLKKLALIPGGLNRHTLAVARGQDSPGGSVRTDHLPAAGSHADHVSKLVREGRHEAARYVATRALAIHGPRPELLCVRGAALAALGEPAMSVRDFEAALGLDPKNRCARLNLGGISLQRGDFARAATLFQGVDRARAAAEGKAVSMAGQAPR